MSLYKLFKIDNYSLKNVNSDVKGFVVMTMKTKGGDNKGTKERFSVFVASFMMYDNVVVDGRISQNLLR